MPAVMPLARLLAQALLAVDLDAFGDGKAPAKNESVNFGLQLISLLKIDAESAISCCDNDPKPLDHADTLLAHALS
jgi:hypothetical protein